MFFAICLPSVSVAQGFNDFESVGRLEDNRRLASPLQAGPHSFTPSFVFKLLGITTPHVFAAASAGWTDNLLQEDQDAPGVRLRREPYARLETGVRLDTALMDHRLELDYRVIPTEYINTGKFDTLEQRGSARLDLLWTDQESHADITWSRAATPQSIQLRGIVRSDLWSAQVWHEARLGIFGLRVGLNGFSLDFQESELSDLDSLGYGLDVQFYGRIQPKLRGLLEYNWGVLRYQHASSPLNDYALHQARLGLDGTLSPKVSLSLKVGGAYQDVDDDSGGDSDAFRGLVSETSIRYELLPRTRLLASYSRLISPSTTSNFLRSDEWRAQLDQLLFEEALRVTPSFTYTRSKPGSGERLNRIRADLNLSYKIRQWLSLAGTYAFTRLGSSLPNSDYRVHEVTLSLGVAL